MVARVRWLCCVGGGCGPAWVLEIGGSLLRMRASRRCGAGASEYACVWVRVGRGAGHTWELHMCAPGVAASEACIHAVRYLIQVVVEEPYMDVHSHGTSTRQEWREAAVP